MLRAELRAARSFPCRRECSYVRPAARIKEKAGASRGPGRESGSGFGYIFSRHFSHAGRAGLPSVVSTPSNQLL